MSTTKHAWPMLIYFIQQTCFYYISGWRRQDFWGHLGSKNYLSQVIHCGSDLIAYLGWYLSWHHHFHDNSRIIYFFGTYLLIYPFLVGLVAVADLVERELLSISLHRKMFAFWGTSNSFTTPKSMRCQWMSPIWFNRDKKFG